MKTIKTIIQEAKIAAFEAAKQTELDLLLRGRADCCGFAWVDIMEYQGKKIRKNSKAGKELVALGCNSYSGLKLWNPSRYPTQNMCTLEAGAKAAAQVLCENGFRAYAGSRMD